MAGESEPRKVVRAHSVLGALALAAAVLLGGMTMTAGWVALYFVSGQEPDAAGAPPDPTPVRAPGKRLLWLVFDAMRTDAAFDAQLMPNLARLRREGVWGVARTGSFTMTGICVRALGTGVMPRPTHVIHNFRSPPIRGDSLFRRVHRSGRRIVLIGDHIWIDLYRNTVRESRPQPDLGIHDLDKTDRAALADARRLLPDHWDLVVLHLVGSDHAAHHDKGVRGNYRKKLAEYDRLIPELRRLMGADAAVLVLADHACNAVGNHGAGELEATHAPYVLSGPGVRALGRRDIDQRAIAPTVTALLGVPAPWGAEVPGLLDGLALSEAERAAAELNHASQRRAHLAAIRGRPTPAVDRRLSEARRLYRQHRYAESRKVSAGVIRRVTAVRLAQVRASPWLWLAVLGLLVALPLLLVSATAVLRLRPHARGASLATVVAVSGSGVAVFLVDNRVSTLIGAAVLAGLAGLWVALLPRRRAVLAPTLMAVVVLGLALLGSWVVEWVVRLHRGDPTGRLWLAGIGLGVLAGPLVWTGVTGRLRRVLADHPGLGAALAATGLFLTLPALRWWSGRHLLVGSIGAAIAAGVMIWAWRTARAAWPVIVGGLILTVTFTLGLAFALGHASHASAPLPWIVAVVVPAGVLLLGGVAAKELRSGAGVAVSLGWVLANVVRLVGLPVTSGAYRIAALVVSGLLLGAFVVVLWTRRARGAFLALLLLGVLRLLVGDQQLTVVALFAIGLLGLARIGWRPSTGRGLVATALVMALLELVVFYQLGREFSFGTIDVTLGFVGGGGIDLVRITVLITVVYAVPWWLLWGAAAELVRGDRSRLVELLFVHLWILTVKVLGTFLLFVGRPAHFWMIHSLIPFQFFALANLIMVGVGFGLAYSVATCSCHWRSSSAESRAML